MKSFLGPHRQTNDSDLVRAFKNMQNFTTKISKWLTGVAMATQNPKNSMLLVAAIFHYLLITKAENGFFQVV